MEFKVIISKRAESNLKSITRYIELNWSTRAKNKFLKNLLKKVEKLSKMAEMYEALDSEDSISDVLLQGKQLCTIGLKRVRLK